MQAAADVVKTRIAELQAGEAITQAMLMEWSGVTKRQAAAVAAKLISQQVLVKRAGQIVVAEPAD